HKLRELTADNSEQQRQLDRLEPLVAKEITLVRDLVTTQQRDGPEAAARRLRTNEDRHNMARIRAAFRAMADAEEVLLRQRGESLERSVWVASAALAG